MSTLAIHVSPGPFILTARTPILRQDRGAAAWALEQISLQDLSFAPISGPCSVGPTTFPSFASWTCLPAPAGASFTEVLFGPFRCKFQPVSSLHPVRSPRPSLSVPPRRAPCSIRRNTKTSGVSSAPRLALRVIPSQRELGQEIHMNGRSRCKGNKPEPRRPCGVGIAAGPGAS